MKRPWYTAARASRGGNVAQQEHAEPQHSLLRSLTADHAFGPLYGLLLLLTVLTGVVDAVSILSLGRVFVANMTGNVVFAAFAVVGAPGFSLSASLFALAGFLVGAYAVAALSGGPGADHGTLGMAGGAFSAAVTDATAALLATALGVQNAVARKLAVPDMTTTVLTMTLTGVGADLRAVFGDRPRAKARSALGRRLLAIAAMIVGALAGASLTLRVSPLSGLVLAAALLAAVTAWVTLAT